MDINVESLFQNSPQKTRHGTPRRYYHDVISGLQENVIISETVHDKGKVTIEHLKEVGVVHSESVIENCV